jgi:hypothetical protein
MATWLAWPGQAWLLCSGRKASPRPGPLTEVTQGVATDSMPLISQPIFAYIKPDFLASSESQHEIAAIWSLVRFI